MSRGSERERMLAELARREREIDPERYAPWNPAELFMREGRRRAAARLLHRAGAFPRTGDRCLEVGCGTLGWLGELISWGVRETDLHGVELSASRLERARDVLPAADLRVVDASDRLPWDDRTFRLVVLSTVVSSVLDPDARRRLAREVERVLAPGGALLWYDFRVDNPKNPHVRGVPKGELLALFPGLSATVRRVTLAPPLVRRIAPRSWWLAGTLELVPLLRTHLVAVLVRPATV